MDKNLTSEVLDVTVEQIFPFGVFVRLPDGTQGYIRRRELALDADVNPTEVTHIGTKIKATIINSDESGKDKDVELSHRATLNDPWPDFLKQYKVGDVIAGVVGSIQSNGVYVRIQSGIDGFIELKEFSISGIEKPDELFWLGDSVEAVISDIQGRFVKLSYQIRMTQYDKALEVASTIFHKTSFELPESSLISEEQDIFILSGQSLEKARPLLLVEDDDNVRDSLNAWLSRTLGPISTAKTVYQALEMSILEYKVIIVDLNLMEQDGLELVREIRRVGSHANIAVMSSPDALARRAKEIEDAQIMDVFPKPLDLNEINQFLMRIAKDKQLDFWQSDPLTPPTSGNLTAQYSEVQTLARLQAAVSETTSLMRAQASLLFQLDPDSETISIPIQVGQAKINPTAIYALKRSPVNDVIKHGRAIHENRVTERAQARFDKLLQLLPFQSCIGVPISVQGEIHHAVFFFHSDSDSFSHYRMRDAQASAMVLSSILTEESIQTHLRALNPKLLSGELAASFGHDVFNKITALEIQARNLMADYQTDTRANSQRLLELVLDLKNTAHAFQQVLLTKETLETVDVNLIIQRAVLLLTDLARKEKTQIVLNLSPDLPTISVNTILLQQVFLNIMLNAIQQMAQKVLNLKWSGKRILEVSTTIKDNIIHIRFKDNGPGIHKSSLSKVFVPGFSTRGGSGLGLFIARSFIQTLGGTIKVEQTFIPTGTTFLVQLPSVEPEIKYA